MLRSAKCFRLRDRNVLPKHEEREQSLTARNSPDHSTTEEEAEAAEEDEEESSTSSEQSDSGEGTSSTDNSSQPLITINEPARRGRSPRPNHRKSKSDSSQANATLTPELSQLKMERDKKLLDPLRSTMWLGTEEGM
ncbi:hypothetical protein Ciccas_009717 [Cichlidogyrus casuarinus]|uniref:Uncharacterized protein n=1 Tax=Cichlidogyrus casuarinus TaxID=1844966 RepID=A0ABD2PW79_9PLAT